MKKLLNILVLGMIILGACNKESLPSEKIEGEYRCEYTDFHTGKLESSVIGLNELGDFGLTSSAGIFYRTTYQYHQKHSLITLQEYPLIDTARGLVWENWEIKKVKGKIILNIPSSNPNYTDLQYVKYK